MLPFSLAAIDISGSFTQTGSLNHNFYVGVPRGWTKKSLFLWKLLVLEYLILELLCVWKLAVEKLAVEKWMFGNGLESLL